jgi:hypothetical protein
MTCVCKRCGIEKPITEYYKTSDRKAGHKTICKECIKADPLTEDKKTYMRNYSKDYHLKVNYGLSREDYNSMLKNQNNCCAICGVHETETKMGKLYVDHNHSTGKVRGLLCHNCNASLGLMKESIDSLAAAISYLNEHQDKNGKIV